MLSWHVQKCVAIWWPATELQAKAKLPSNSNCEQKIVSETAPWSVDNNKHNCKQKTLLVTICIHIGVLYCRPGPIYYDTDYIASTQPVRFGIRSCWAIVVWCGKRDIGSRLKLMWWTLVVIQIFFIFACCFLSLFTFIERMVSRATWGHYIRTKDRLNMYDWRHLIWQFSCSLDHIVKTAIQNVSIMYLMY